MIDVVVLNYNDYLTTETFVNSLSSYKEINRIVIVDNCSTDESAQRLSKLQNQSIFMIVNSENKGYGSGNNVGIRFLWEKFNSSIILVSNPDVIIDEETINSLQDFLRSHNDYAIIAPFMCSSNGEKELSTAWKLPTCWEYIFSMGMILGKIKSVYYKDIMSVDSEYMNVGAVAGSLFMVKTESFINAGMFDENIFLYGEETVIGIKIKNSGAKIGLLLKKSFIHNHASSTNKVFKSEIKKKKIQMNSKMYILKKYYEPTWLQLTVASILSKTYLLEIALWNNIKRIKQKENNNA